MLNFFVVKHQFFRLQFFMFDSCELNETKGMNEDGSFIGQYGRKGRGPDSNSQAFATLV